MHVSEKNTRRTLDGDTHTRHSALTRGMIA
jgi:hypothetical protein